MSALTFYFLHEISGDKRRKQPPPMTTVHQSLSESVMLIFPIVTAGFAVLIVIAVILWKSGASEPN